MIIIFAMIGGAFIGISLMGLLLCAKGDDACENFPYKRFYINSITEEKIHGWTRKI